MSLFLCMMSATIGMIMQISFQHAVIIYFFTQYYLPVVRLMYSMLNLSIILKVFQHYFYSGIISFPPTVFKSFLFITYIESFTIGMPLLVDNPGRLFLLFVCLKGKGSGVEEGWKEGLGEVEGKGYNV